MGIIVRAKNYINTTAQAAHLHSLMKYRFSANGYRPNLKGARKAGYFFLGLGRSLLDVFNPFGSLNPMPPKMDHPLFESASISNQVVPVEIRITPTGINKSIDPNSNAMITISDSGGKRSDVSEVEKNKIYMAMMGSRFKVLSLEEIAKETGYSVGKVAVALNTMMDEPQVGKPGISHMGNFVYFSALKGEELRAEYQSAKQRNASRYSVFLQEIVGKITTLRNLPSTATIHDVLKIVNEDRHKLGIRLLDVFLYNSSDGSLHLEQQEALSGNFYRPPQHPEPFMKSVLEGNEYHYVIELGKNNNAARGNFQKSGLNWNSGLGNVFNNLRRGGKEYLLIIKALSAEKVPQAVFVISNPLFFGAEKDEEVIGMLNRFAKIVGRTLGKVRGEEAAAVVAPTINAQALPAEPRYDSQRELEFWNWVFSSGSGRNNVGLEAKIGGPVTDAHRRDFKIAISGRLSEALSKGKVKIWEDAAGATSIASLLLEQLMKGEDDGSRFLPDDVLQKFNCVVRDFSEIAVGQAETAIAEAGFDQIVSVMQGDMFKRSEQDDNSVDFIVACMAFYCTRERFRTALREWARISKAGAMGWFSMKHKDGDLNVAKKDTIKGVWRSIPLWQKIIFPVALGKIIGFLIRRKRAGAFKYGRLLNEGFHTGKYYAPTEEQLREDLDSAGLQDVTISRSLAGQFFLVEWKKKPEDALA